MPTDPLLRLAELLGAVAERLVTIELRLIEAVGALDARMKRGGERAGKAERATAEALSRLATAEAIANLRAEQVARHTAIMEAFARVDARLDRAETRPAPTTWADVVSKHPALSGALVTLILALATYLGSMIPQRADEPVTPPTAVIPGASSRLMNDRRLADGGEG
jgi:hypothetical protein